MTLKHIFNQYHDKIMSENDIDNFYSDMLKKLKRSFECLGFFDLSVLKYEDRNDFNILEKDKEYILYLLEAETNPLYKKIRKGTITIGDFPDYIEEIEKLLNFLSNYITEEATYKSVEFEIYSNTHYPMLKRYVNQKYYYENVFAYINAIIYDDKNAVGDSGFLYLTVNDKLELFDEFINYIHKWINLTQKAIQYRTDEFVDHLFDLNMDNLNTFFTVKKNTSALCVEEISKLQKPDLNKCKNFKSQIKKSEQFQKEVEEIELKVANEYCQKYGYDYEKYKEERSVFLSLEYDVTNAKIMMKEIKDGYN